MRGFILASAALAIAGFCHAEAPRSGEAVDLAAFGHPKSWDGNPGVEWDEPRDISRVEVDFPPSGPAPVAGSLKIEYWVSSWPPEPSGGWTKTDTPWQGEWRTVEDDEETTGNTIVCRFKPLSEAENPNARNVPGYTPEYRKTLKLRLRFAGDYSDPSALRIYGNSRWNLREINLQSGLEGKPHRELSVMAYNGVVGGSEPLKASPPGIRLKVLYTEHEPDSNDRTILTIRGGSESFGVCVDDIIARKGVYVRPLGIFLGDAAVNEDFAGYLESGIFRPGEDIISRTLKQPEQSMDRALAEVPRLAFTVRSARHPLRYIPLGFPASREKYGLDFNGNVFISKTSSKAMKEDLARMLWYGDEIYFRLGTGSTPDFRERELAARQSLLDDELPLVVTEWETEGISYREQAYATLLDAPLDDTRLDGDEPTVVFLRLNARNPETKTAEARVWFLVTPLEQFVLKNGLLLATADPNGKYTRPRLRADIEPAQGSLELRELTRPPELQLETLRRGRRQKAIAPSHPGTAVLWKVSLPPRGFATLDIKIPFRTVVDLDEQARVEHIRFDTRMNATLDYWKNATAQGMRVQVPDKELNRFFNTSLQHILVSDERDVKTGLDMCPCGTYDYNMFANETEVLVRMLDMRGLHDWAWRCLRPIVELQGSKPFPGNFRHTEEIFHGVRVDAEHDYTSSGYNLNHGWTLWTLAEHYLYTRDDEWLKTVMPRLVKAADWIIRERQATIKHDGHGDPVPEYGLLPAGQLEDNEDFEYWFAVNGYAYLGLRTAAEAVSAVDSEVGRRLSREADDYRTDIRRAVFHAMATAPVVPLRDGTFVPAIPPRTSLHGRDLGWIRNILYGAHTLVDCGIFNADEPVAMWILQDYENNLFMAEDSFSVPDRDWFSRGGITLQPNLVNTFVSYLQRDELPLALRAFYNDFAASYYPDVAAFTEWEPTFGIGGGPFFKTSDEAKSVIWFRLMLVREAPGRLYLNFGAPRVWFLPGRAIRVEHAATYFGETAFDVESHTDEGYIQAHILPPRRTRPREIVLRLRNPEGKKMIRVELNGRDWRQFDAEREVITIPREDGKVNVRAFFP
ncbi:MAG: hypothetical protein DMG21_16250 [Acidobacteria bacterium]|nr:MAG: hypothetical protein DMG21_16250 [Acidobacteriota bacterium]